jgi:uncharacterized protein (TIGR03083 family)
MGIDAQSFRAHLDRELTAYAERLRHVDSADAWATPVPSCPGWAVRDLTHHLIGLHYWVTDALNGGSGRKGGPPMPADADLTTAFGASAAMLQEALTREPQTPSWTFATDESVGAGTVGFWQRRQPHEHAIHRWDLDAALDAEPSLDAELSADGIDEVVNMFWPRQVALGRTEEPTAQLQLVAADGGQGWTIGSLSPTTPVATLTGTAPQLLLALWKRIPADSPTLRWSGDQAAGLAVLNRRIVP